MPVAEHRIIEVYEIERWLPAGTTAYASRRFNANDIAGRWEVVGEVAPDDVRRRYVGKSVEAYFPKGSMNPVAYALEQAVTSHTDG